MLFANFFKMFVCQFSSLWIYTKKDIDLVLYLVRAATCCILVGGFRNTTRMTRTTE